MAKCRSGAGELLHKLEICKLEETRNSCTWLLGVYIYDTSAADFAF